MKILKAIGAAVLAVAYMFSARAEESTTETLVKEPLILDGIEAGYTVSGLPNNEVAVVFTNHVDGAVTWTAPADLENVQFLVVGGGGGGGSKTAGGGGGGGGVITGSVFSISSSAAIEVQVGGGGKGGEGDGKTGAKGSDSKFKVGGVTYVTAYGGGYGAPRNKTGSSGGSGGGGEKGGGAATQGSADSNYVSYVKHGYEGYDGGWNAGGGGGGATAAGSSLTGGLGLSSFITGEECVYGSGGDGKKASGTGSSGAANSGDGGGGGGGGNGGSGGSGIVVLRYTLPTGGLVAAPESIDPKSYTGTALTPNVPELLGYTVIVNNNVDCIDAGNYNVVLKLNEGFTWKDAEGDAASADKTLTFTITQAENAWETAPSITPAVWEEEATPGTFVNGTPEFGEVVVAYTQNGNTLDELPTTRGNYEAVFTVTGNNNYTGLSKTIAFEILAVVNHWTVEPSISLTSWMEGAIPGTVTPGATRFSAPAATISKDGGEATTFSGTMPTEPGSYVITYTAPAATEDYSAPEVTEKTVSFTILEYSDNPEVTTTAMSNPSWGYVVDYLGENHNETVVVFTNHTAAMTWTAPYDVKNVEFLVVGGGGGGGADNKDTDNRQGGAGGGGGGVVTGFVDFEYGQTVAVTVGAGGAGGTAGKSYSSGYGASRSGEDSSFGVGDVAWVTAYGGGRDRGAKTEEGFTDGYAGGEGGSGAGGRPGMSGGAATQGEAVLDYVTSAEKHGYAGGDGCPTPYSSYGNAAAGGGGGAGGAGQPGYYVADTNDHVGGAGGAGFVSAITGTQVSYGAGGGGGSSHGYGSVGGEGAGNGGNYLNDGEYTGGDALANQGGGGGGAGNQADGGNGGSGIVVFRYCTAKAEAKVDGNVYATLEEAVAAATAGSTVTVLADAEIDSSVVVEKALTIDLNGKTIKSNDSADSADGNGVFWVKTGGVLTIEGDGTVDGNGGNAYKMAVWADGGSVVINGGTYVNYNNGTDDQYDLIYVKNGGSVVINDGVFKCQTPRWTLNIKNGDGQGSITVNGGKFYGFNPADCDTDDLASYCPAGYCGYVIETVNEVNVYGIAPAVAQVGEVKYASLADALAAAVDGNTITLLANVQLTDNVTVDKNVTLAVGANTLTLPTGKTITVAAGKSLTVACGTGGLVVDGTIAVNGTLDVSALSYGASGLIANKAGNLAIAATGSVKLMSVWDSFSPNWLATNSSAFFKDSVTGAQLVQGSGTYTFNGTTWLVANAVAVTQVTANGKTYQEGFATLAAAIAASVDGSVKLIADATEENVVTVSEGVTLDLNGKSLQVLAVFGDLAMNGGSLKTYDTTTQTYYFMAAPAETAGALFWTSDAVLNVSSENYGLVLKSGAITMPNTWRSLVGQSLAINAGASFTIPENVTWNLRGNATVDNDATLVCAGTISLGESIDTIDTTATLTTTNDTLHVVSACEGYEVQYANGAYTLVAVQVAGKWDEVIDATNGSVSEVTDENKADVEGALDALAVALGATEESASVEAVTGYFSRAYGSAKVPATALTGGSDNFAVSVAYDLPLMEELPEVTVAKATEGGALAFEFTLAGVTIAGSADNAVKLVKYSATVNGTYVYDGGKMTVTVAGGKLKAVFKGSDAQGFAKVDFTVPTSNGEGTN